MNKKRFLLGLVAAITIPTLLTSCFRSGEDKVGYIPFKSDEDGKWGMISTKGEVLFEREFRNAPTVATDNRFFVQNQDGFWELYSTEETPKRYGEEMRYASLFSCGSAMVTPRNGSICIINTKGEVTTPLETFENKKVTAASPFVGRNAVVSCDTIKGVIDVKGKTVIAPSYSRIDLLQSGKMIASAYDFASTHLDNYDTIAGKGKQLLLDSDGKEIFSIDGTKYWTMVKEGITDKYITVKERKITMKTEYSGGQSYSYPEVEWIYSVLDYEGKTVIAPRKEIDKILAISEDYFIYTNSDQLCGVMTIDGKTVIKPEYDGINFIGDNYISVMKNGTESNDWQTTFRLLDNNGKPVGHTVFTAIAGNTNLRGFTGKNVFACEGEHDWIALDEKGVKIPNLPKMYEMLPYSMADVELKTDKVNFTELFKGIKIAPSSLGGYHFNMGPRAAIEEQQKQWGMDNNGSRPKASEYSWMQDIYIFGDVDGLDYSGEVHFPQTLSKQTYRQEKVIDYTWGNYYWYHLENIPAGFVFNNITPSTFKLTFNHWTYYGKLRDLYKALVEYCKKWGTVEDSNNAATLLNLENGKKMLIAMTPEEVIIKWGKLPQEDTWIGNYINNSEKLESTYQGDLYLASMVNNCYSSGDIEEEGD